MVPQIISNFHFDPTIDKTYLLAPHFSSVCQINHDCYLLTLNCTQKKKTFNSEGGCVSLREEIEKRSISEREYLNREKEEK